MALLKRLTQAFCLFLPILLLSGTASAAPLDGPPSDAAINFVSWVGNELNNMVDGHIDLFVSEGKTNLWDVAAVLLVWYLLIGLLSKQLRNEAMVELVFNFMIADMMLQFYDTPMPWGGVSFHQLFSAEAAWAAGTLDISTATDLLKSTIAIYKDMEIPRVLNIFGVFVYGTTAVQLALIWLFTSGITLIAHIALGFGSLVGPLLICFFVWPVMSWLFWGWIRFMVTYALYIISSSAIVYLYAHVMMYFINHVIGLDYSLGHFSAILLPFAALNGIFIIAFWQCHSWATNVASGSASMGSTVSSMVHSAALAFLA
jgi:hypothetical protein